MYRVLFLFILFSALPSTFLSSISAAEQIGNPSIQTNWENRLQSLLKTHGLLLNQMIEANYYNKPADAIDALKQNLLSNAHDLATLFSSFLGSQAGREFEPLFDRHIKLGGEYINAAKNSLSTKSEIAAAALQNGNQIADLFSRWFPSTPNREWRKMLAEHVNLEAKQADAYFSNDINKGLAIKEESLKQLAQIGNFLIAGIHFSANRRDG